MAVRPTDLQQGIKAAAAALLVLAGWVTGPALAAPDHDESQQALTATPANSSEELLQDHLLKPRVEATARKVFATAEETEQKEGDADEVESPAPGPVVQGLSDGEVVPLKRQMYRRDI
jgi:hypothetical protein